MKRSTHERFGALLLILAMLLGICPTALAAEPAAHIIVNQVYGGGSDGTASHSFIEIYNPTDKETDLSGWSIQYRSSTSGPHSAAWNKLDLTGSIQAEGYYLIRYAATSTASPTFTVPEGNQEWAVQLHNKGLSVALVNNQTLLEESVKGDVSSMDSIIDLAACAGNDHKPSASASDNTQLPPAWEGDGFSSTDGLQSKKKAVRRTGFSDSGSSAVDFTAIDYSKPVSEELQPHAGVSKNEPESFSADSLTLQPGRTAAAVNLNWYAPQRTTSAKVRFGDQTVDAAVSPLHTPTKLDAGKYKDTGKLVCKATVEGLMADTRYTYQISNDGGETWSKEYSYATPENDSFTFAFTSDPQIKENGETDAKGWNPSDGKNQTGWAKMVDVIEDAGATLIVSAGDQVEDQSWGKSDEYEAFFAPEGLTSLAYAPAVGNHDRHYMFADHFNLPNEMVSLDEIKTTFRGQNSGTSQSHGNYIQATEDERNRNTESNGVRPNSDGYYDFAERREMETKGNYFFCYNNVLFITLNTGAYPGGNDIESGTQSGAADNSEAESIVDNFRDTVTAAKAAYAGQYDWIIVTHHKSTQTVAKHAADSDIENYVDAGFEKLMADEDVDFVLGGHDHVYSRSYVLDSSGKRVSERLDTIHNASGVIYITGNCCSDMQYYTPFEKLDKNNNADYPVLANGKTGSQAYLEGNGKSGAERAGYLPVGNQEWNQEYSPSYVLFTVKGNSISATAYNLDGDSHTPNSKEIDSFTVTKNMNGGNKAVGFENGKSKLDITQVARYDSGMTNAEGGVMEIVAYNAETGWAYAVNGQAGVLTAIPLDAKNSKLTVGNTVNLLEGYNIDVKALVEAEGFAYGDMTSVAVSPNGGMLAAAIQAEGYADNGRVALFTCNGDGTLTFLQAAATGVQPDMVAFTPDSRKLLTANEGEPREGYGAGTQDPAGSVTVVDMSNYSARTIGFTAFDHETARSGLVNAGIVLKKNTAPSVDLEPEYIACDNDTAYVTCQEANAIAVLDLNSDTFTGIYSAGFEDYSQIPIDLGNGDHQYAPHTYENLKGIRMPDAVALYHSNGESYLLTANEGDSRAWGDEQNDNCNEYKNKTSLNGKSFENKITWFNAAQYDGLENGVDYLFGGRSFTIFKATDSGLEEVFDSGSDFEAKTASYLPAYFNCSNDSLEKEDRSGKKGPEPETVTVGKINGKSYAFITLERIGGVMVYDISQPRNATYINYINSRDFSTPLGADDSPEGLKFVSSDKSPTGKALLFAACEVGGTVAVYELIDASGASDLKAWDIAVISDDHLYRSDVLGGTGAAFEQYLTSDRKLLLESEAILDTALEELAASGVKYLLIPGDLTKDGEKINHELLAQKLAKLEADTDIEVFVINGNHDVSNAHAVSFSGSDTTRVETINTDDFRSIYHDFGYGQAVAVDQNSLSYAVDLGTEYRLIVMDACIYNDNKEDPEQKTAGEFRENTLNWVLEQIKAAVKAGRRPIGMMHHGLVPHTAVQPTMFSEYLVKDYQTIAAKLADAGMNLVFTGHFHSQDVSSITTDKGNVLYDVETGSLVTSPCPIRYVALEGNKFSYTTENITKVKGIDNFKQYAADFLREGMNGLVNVMLPNALRALGITDQAQIDALCGNDELKSLLVGGFIAHYAGDEQINAETAEGLRQLAQINNELASVVSSLYTDSAPADRVGTSLPLSALPTYPSNGGGSSVSTYTITVEKSEHGKVTSNRTSASNGSTVTLTVAPDEGYVLDTLTVADSRGREIKLTAQGDGKYTFIMPGMAVTVKAAFAPLPDDDEKPCDGGADCPSRGFTDLGGVGTWYHEAADYALRNNMMDGYGGGRFGPNDNLSRAQLAQILYNREGKPVVTSGSTFTDVTSHAWYAPAVAWAAAQNVVAGYGNGMFGPNDPITREQLAVMLWRYANKPVATKKELEFTDTDKISNYAQEALQWAVEQGIIQGKGDGILDPKGKATRAEAAAMLMRYLSK